MYKKPLAVILPVILALAIIAGIFYVTESKAIVNATVMSTRLDLPGDGFAGLHGKYISLINLTDTYPHKTPIDSTRSDCPLEPRQKIVVQVLLQRGLILYQGNLPVRANMTLYKPDGLGFIPWNGC